MRGKITDPGLPSSAGMPLPPGAAAWILGPVAAATGRLGDRGDDVPPGRHEPTATTAAAINSHHRIMRSPQQGRIRDHPGNYRHLRRHAGPQGSARLAAPYGQDLHSGAGTTATDWGRDPTVEIGASAPITQVVE